MYYQALTGRKIGHWTVLGVDSHGADMHSKMLCRCDCGTIRAVDAYSLKHHLTSSCGRCKEIIHEDDYGRCTMRNGVSFLFDLKDESLIKEHSWSVAGGHVRTTINGKSVYLHQLILGDAGGPEIDHINGDKLDNRRVNLRPATHSQNNQNKGLRKDSSTGYKGVCFDKRQNRFIAYINADGRRTYLGNYENAEDAAKAYDRAALLLHGEFARPNFMKEEFYESEVLAVG